MTAAAAENVPEVSPDAKVSKPLAGPGAFRARIEELEDLVKTQGQTLARQDILLRRLADAMGRRDLLAPPATVEQLRAAHKAGQSVLVLKDCKSHGLDLRNGTKVEIRQFPLEDIIELVERGLLAVAVSE